MEPSVFIIVLVIAVFSVVQSIFGVGLLVFGTPTFLLLGVSYVDAVGYLLPSSLLLSFLQTHGFKNKIRIARGIVLYAIPFSKSFLIKRIYLDLLCHYHAGMPRRWIGEEELRGEEWWAFLLAKQNTQ